MSGAISYGDRPHVTLVIRLSEIECRRFQALLDRATADGDLTLFSKRVMDCLDFVLPTENVRERVAGHLFAVYLDKNFNGERFDVLAPARSDA